MLGTAACRLRGRRFRLRHRGRPLHYCARCADGVDRKVARAHRAWCRECGRALETPSLAVGYCYDPCRKRARARGRTGDGAGAVAPPGAKARGKLPRLRLRVPSRRGEGQGRVVLLASPPRRGHARPHARVHAAAPFRSGKARPACGAPARIVGPPRRHACRGPRAGHAARAVRGRVLDDRSARQVLPGHVPQRGMRAAPRCLQAAPPGARRGGGGRAPCVIPGVCAATRAGEEGRHAVALPLAGLPGRVGARRPPPCTAQACAGRCAAAAAAPAPPRGAGPSAAAAAGCHCRLGPRPSWRGREVMWRVGRSAACRRGARRAPSFPLVRPPPQPYSRPPARPPRIARCDCMRGVRPRVCPAPQRPAPLLRPVQGQGGKRGGRRAPRAVQGVRERLPDAEPRRPLLLRLVPPKGIRGLRRRPVGGAHPASAQRDIRVPHVRQAVQRAGPNRPLLLGPVPKGGLRAQREHVRPPAAAAAIEVVFLRPAPAGRNKVPRVRPRVRGRCGAGQAGILLGRLPRRGQARQGPREDAAVPCRPKKARPACRPRGRGARPLQGRGRRAARREERAVRGMRRGVCDAARAGQVLLGHVPEKGPCGQQTAPSPAPPLGARRVQMAAAAGCRSPVQCRGQGGGRMAEGRRTRNRKDGQAPP